MAVGDRERARRLLREAVELSREEGDTFSAASSFHSLGDVELDSGAIAGAEAAYREALSIAWATGSDRIVCYCVAGLAAVAAARDDAERASLLWGFAEGYEERLRFTMRWRTLYERHLVGLAGTDEGRRLDVGKAVELALS